MKISDYIKATAKYEVWYAHTSTIVDSSLDPAPNISYGVRTFWDEHKAIKYYQQTLESLESMFEDGTCKHYVLELSLLKEELSIRLNYAEKNYTPKTVRVLNQEAT